MHIDYIHPSLLPTFHRTLISSLYTLCPNFVIIHSCLSLMHGVQLMLPICIWLWGHPLEHGEPTSSHTEQERWLTLSQQPSTVNSSSVRCQLGVGPWEYPLHAGSFNQLDLVCSETLCTEFLCVTVLVCNNHVISREMSFTALVSIFWLPDFFLFDVFFIYISNDFPFSGSPFPASPICPLPSTCSPIYPFPLPCSGIPLYCCIESFQNQGPLLHSFWTSFNM